MEFQVIFGLISPFLSNRQLWVVLDGMFSQEYLVNTRVAQSSILGPTLFLLYINDLPNVVICDTANDATLYSKCDQSSVLWQQLALASEVESDLRDTVDWSRRALLISMLEKLNLFCLMGLITLVLLIWRWMGLFLTKNHLLRCLGCSVSL